MIHRRVEKTPLWGRYRALRGVGYQIRVRERGWRARKWEPRRGGRCEECEAWSCWRNSQSRIQKSEDGDETYAAFEMSSTWLHRATNKSKKSWLPPLSISSCMVPLRLKVLRLRMMRAR